MKRKQFTALLMATAMVVGALSGCGGSSSASTESSSTASSSSGSSGDVIKIGVSGPTTGDSAESGVHVNTGIQMAIDEVNEAGGITIDGEKKQVEAIYYDTGSDAQTGVSNCQRLITSDQVDFLWCETFNSAVGIATMELAGNYDIPMATLEPVSSAISDKILQDPEKYANFFKFGWDSSAYGETCANTILELVEEGKLELPNKTFAICGDETDYGRSNLAAVADKMEAAGYTMVSENYWQFGSTDLYSVISDIKSSGADMIFSCSTTVATGVALIRQLRENGMDTMPHMAIYFPGQPEFMNQIGNDADGLLWAPMLIDTEHNEVYAEFAEKLKAYNGDDLTFDHIDGYSGMKVVLDAMEKAGSLETDKFMEAVMSDDGFDVPKGHIVFGKDNHTIMHGEGYVPVNAAQIQDGTSYVIYPASEATSEYQPIQ